MKKMLGMLSALGLLALSGGQAVSCSGTMENVNEYYKIDFPAGSFIYLDKIQTITGNRVDFINRDYLDLDKEDISGIKMSLPYSWQDTGYYYTTKKAGTLHIIYE